MGVIEKTYYDNLPNATTCNTIGDVFQTHADKNQELKMELKFMYGMLVLHGIGAGVAMITFYIEVKRSYLVNSWEVFINWKHMCMSL